MASEAALVDRLVAALFGEEEARRAVGDALREQARLLRELRAVGLPASRVAQRVALARGLVLPIEDRLRLAERLRKRAWRGTRRPADLALPHGQTASADSRSERAIMPVHGETTMPERLIKRVITEEYVSDEDEDLEGLEAEEDDETEDEADEHAPGRRSKPSRK